MRVEPGLYEEVAEVWTRVLDGPRSTSNTSPTTDYRSLTVLFPLAPILARVYFVLFVINFKMKA